MKYYLIAGEASGDLHASNLIESIMERDPHAEFRFLGGDLMEEKSGVKPTIHYREMAYMGFVPVLLNLDKIFKNLKVCKQEIAQFNPDVVILIDYPGFNLKIAKYVKQQLGIPVYYYISPKVWAWKEYRVKSFKKYVDVMLSILPFEPEYYKKHDYEVQYVGNPTVDAIATRPHREETFREFTEVYNLPSRPIIALLAGSRKQEIKDNLPVMLESVKGFAGYQFVIAGAPGIEQEYYDQFIQGMSVTVIFNETYRVLAQSEAALVTSGTATLEAGLLNVPQVVCYKTPLPKFIHWAFKNILTTPYISLVNLICDHEVVKELFAKYFSVDNIRKELYQIIYTKRYRRNMLDNYDELRRILGEPGASERAADIIVEDIQPK